ncbi:tRNA lysidine(34) synthetase TilS [Treponema primitia]|uniref:tRNA lysidine(34) synthetase TilS n=1 Tax=Treponema primitia TaxID=88058 RepID=UPI00397F885F
MDRHAFEASVAAGLGSWPEDTVFLAAVSGGADSTAMLAALAALGRFEFRCLHVEHGIRPAPESRGDAAAVEALCAEFGIPCSVVSITPGKIERTAKKRGIGIEAAARLYRHAAWNAEARRVGAAKVLVAHTREDLLETALMRILRGSGPAGLAAMPRSRGIVIRPILDRSRAEILAYLEERGIPYRTDSTNTDPKYLRNRIRHKLIPCLDEFFPGWRKTLPDLAETQRMAADFLEAESAARIPWKEEERGLSVSSNSFFAQPPLVREEALFAALDRMAEKGRVKPPRRRNLRLFAQGAFDTLDLGFAILKKDTEKLSLGLPRTGETGFSLLIKEPGIYKLKGLTIRAFSGENTALLATEFPAPPGFFAALPLVLRRNYPEDYIVRGSRKRRGAESVRAIGSTASGLITAEDTGGPAAFIGRGRDGFEIVLTRKEAVRENHLFFSIE